MNLKRVYQWRDEIRKRLSSLGKWQALGLALFSIGVALSERSTLSKIAEKLWMAGRVESLERRMQRWLANERIDMKTCCEEWTRWVISHFADTENLILLVDLTGVSDRVDTLVIGLAYRNRCIPLAWRCQPGDEPWSEKQVTIIKDLLEQVSAGIPEGCIPIVEADRGIGNSSDLMTVVAEMGWHFLFRVKDSSTIELTDGSVVPLASLITIGRAWSGEGHIFSSKSPVPVRVHLVWNKNMAESWCLATNAPHLTHHTYAKRNWQEQSFRDLKSGGWQWQRSQVRQPSHADRLLLVLVVAYAWAISLGTRAIRAGKTSRRQLVRGSRRRLSVFRLGLRYLSDCFRTHAPPDMTLFFYPALP